MNRITCLFCAAVVLIVTATLSAQAARKPNLLIIQTDEHNFRTLGCYRALLPPEQAFIWGPGVAVETPKIDWLAKNGAIVERFYATSPVCTPSRAALMTGWYPQNTGAIGNNHPMRPEMATFAEVLRGSSLREIWAVRDGPGVTLYEKRALPDAPGDTLYAKRASPEASELLFSG